MMYLNYGCKKLKGSKYYVGQHGNSYYTLKIFPRIEEKTTDKFYIGLAKRKIKI